MKKSINFKFMLLCLGGAILFLASCQKENIDETITVNPIEPNYTVEGKWIWSPSENRADANTMYEFVDGTRYKSYAIDTDFNDLDSSDRIPGSDPYIFYGDTLVIDGTPLGITFECDGGIIIMDNEQWSNQLWRLSSDCQ